MAIFAHLLALFTLVSSPAEDPFKTLSLADALTQAGAAHQVVMVDFFTTWCPPCKHLDAVTWKDERVRAWLAANTVALKLDAEKEHATAKKYRVSAYPTMVFLRPDGTEFGRIVGFKGPDDFLRQAGVVLAKKSPVAEEGPFKQLSLADALTQAGAAKKVVMIDYFTTWCGPCKQLDAETWKDERVRAWLAANTVALKLDAEKEVETAGKHHVQAYPTMLFLRPDGTELGRIVGFRGAEDFVKQAGDVLAGKGRIDQLQGQLAAGGGSDLMLRNDLGDELAQAGRDAEALEQYLYCWDHGVGDPGFRGVRASFLLGDIVSLGRSHPPALDALRQRRDACEAAVMGGGVDLQQAGDLGCLNKALGNEEGTLRVYDALTAREDLDPEGRAALRSRLFEDVVDQLLDARRYQDLLDARGDYKAAVDGYLGPYEGTQELLKDEKGLGSMLQGVAAARSAKFYEALLGVGRLDEARALGERLIAFDPAPRTYRMLIRRAKKAKAADEAAALRKRLDGLPEEPAEEASSGDESLPGVNRESE